MADRDAANRAIRLYNDLSALDEKIKAIHVTRANGTPLQKVTFYMGTACYSGQADYEPKFVASAIVEAIKSDMLLARAALVSQLQNIGFDAPALPLE